MTATDLLEHLRKERLVPLASEAALQERLWRALEPLGFAREVPIDAKSRPDFKDGGLLVEVKTKGSLGEIERQLLRYALHPDTRELVLVTTKSHHLNVSQSFRRGGESIPVHVAFISGL